MSKTQLAAHRQAIVDHYAASNEWWKVCNSTQNRELLDRAARLAKAHTRKAEQLLAELRADLEDTIARRCAAGAV